MDQHRRTPVSLLWRMIVAIVVLVVVSLPIAPVAILVTGVFGWVVLLWLSSVFISALSVTVFHPPRKGLGMLSRQFVRENPEAVEEALDLRGIDDVDLDEILQIEQEWRDLESHGGDLRHERNTVSNEIGELKREAFSSKFRTRR